MSLVSIITPTYNRAHLIERAIRSVQQQTYANFEHIIVDDGSTDNTGEVVRKWTETDKRIKYFKTPNGGCCAARNYGFDRSSGEFVTYLDSDDEYYPSKVSEQVELFSTSLLPHLGIVTCGKNDYRDGQFQGTFRPSVRGNILEPLFRKKTTIGATTSFLMVRRQILADGVRWDPRLKIAEDFDFVAQVCMNYAFDFVPEALVKMNHHSGPRQFEYRHAGQSYDILYEKYQEVIRSNGSIHRGFLDKYLFMKCQSGEVADALSVYRSDYPKNHPNAIIWGVLLRGGLANPKSTVFRIGYKAIKKL